MTMIATRSINPNWQP